MGKKTDCLKSGFVFVDSEKCGNDRGRNEVKMKASSSSIDTIIKHNTKVPSWLRYFLFFQPRRIYCNSLALGFLTTISRFTGTKPS